MSGIDKILEYIEKSVSGECAAITADAKKEADEILRRAD